MESPKGKSRPRKALVESPKEKRTVVFSEFSDCDSFETQDIPVLRTCSRFEDSDQNK